MQRSPRSAPALASVLPRNGPLKPHDKRQRPGSAAPGQRPKPQSRPEGAPARRPPTTVLPVDESRDEVVRLIQKNQVSVIVGETGSGKSTKIPQFVWDHVIKPSGGSGGVCCTQPRRVAATSIATYVAECRGGKPGEEVGYVVRFDEKVSKKTKLRFVTDGILLRELLADPQLRKYDCVLLDEAHERTLHGDVLFGLLKGLAQRRPSLKIVIMSATLNAEQFSTFWGGCPIGFIEGRSFPVEVQYTKEPQAEYVDAALNTVLQIHLQEPVPGDILCFLTGQDEIEQLKEVLDERAKLVPADRPGFVVDALYAAMPPAAQKKAFEPAPPGKRKIILATNIAETSITIEGIKYVVDTGVVKAREFDPEANIDRLSVVPISRAQARQRAGRAGRVSSGKCYRLYTEESFYEDLPESTVPEIKRSSLASVVLQMRAMGIMDILGFEFMDPPSRTGLLRALQQLVLIGALDSEGNLSDIGKEMVRLPVEPMAARAIIAAIDLGVEPEVCAIMALLSSDASIFSKNSNLSGEVFKAKATGDHITYLQLFQKYRQTKKDERVAWCHSHGLNDRQMSRSLLVFSQLLDMAQEISAERNVRRIAAQRNEDVDDALAALKEKRTEAKKDVQWKAKLTNTAFDAGDAYDENSKVRRALTYGFFLHAAMFNHHMSNYVLAMAQGVVVKVHPSSVLKGLPQKLRPPLVLYNALVKTTDTFMRDVVAIREEWLREACPTLFKQATAHDFAE